MGNGSRITISNKSPRMDIYRLMVIHWSIFTLSIQLIYCASIYSNIDSSSISNSICSPDIEHFVSSDGRESSLTLDLYPSSYPTSSCKRILTPPELHGFFIRLARVPKTPIKSHNTGPSASSSSSSSSSSMISSRRYGSKGHNSTTRLCPLTIFSLSEPTTTPWVIDPCQLESHVDIEDPVKLMQGRLKIIWNHDGNSPSSKLIITVLGKGLPCQQSNKHPCLKFGMEALLCISKDLICDGVQHCPSGSEYNSDEDELLCSNDSNNSNKEDSIWEHFTMDVFRKFLNSDAILPTPQPPPDMIPSTTTTTTNNSKGGLSTNKQDDKTSSNSINKKIGADVEIRRNSTGRSSLTSDLSRYGPWGYLMLGMLLCGGALLMCGLWECCCRQNKPSSGSATAAGGETTTGSSDTTGTTSSSTGTTTQADPPPPNYDELDPPPAYAVLFPNQKPESSSNMSSSTNLAATNATNNSNSTDSQTTNQSN